MEVTPLGVKVQEKHQTSGFKHSWLVLLCVTSSVDLTQQSLCGSYSIFSKITQ